ncbi:MAG: dethiobiotin synthase [Gammaproteobacteria bacterium]
MATRRAGYFVTGTDTGVGKTLVSQILLHQLRREYARVAGFKPVASGCEMTPEGLRNSDALALQRASSIALAYATVNPYAFAPAVAPHLAAAAVGVRIDCAQIAAGIEAVAADARVVEGVGGWLVPLNRHETVADLAVRLGLPVVLVVGLRLGCLNHALLTVESMRRRAVPIAGWVANQIEPALPWLNGNLDALETRLGLPLLLSLPWHAHPPDPAAWAFRRPG